MESFNPIENLALIEEMNRDFWMQLVQKTIAIEKKKEKKLKKKKKGYVFVPNCLSVQKRTGLVSW